MASADIEVGSLAMEAISHSSGPIFGKYHIVMSTSYSAELWGAEGQRPDCPVLTPPDDVL